MKKKNPKIQHFLLQQQLPDDLRAAPPANHRGGGGSNSSSTPILPSSSTRVINAADQVQQLTLESCRCVHLQQYLPHLLNLELCRSTKHPRGWIMANPVHSLHLASTQFESATPMSQRNRPPPVLYGEEQQRTEALRTKGIVEYWSPLDGFATTLEEEEEPVDPEVVTRLKTIEKQQQQEQERQQKLAETPSSPETSRPAKRQKLDHPEAVESEPTATKVVVTSDSKAASATTSLTSDKGPQEKTSIDELKPSEVPSKDVLVTAEAQNAQADIPEKTNANHSYPMEVDEMKRKTDKVMDASETKTSSQDVVMADDKPSKKEKSNEGAQASKPDVEKEEDNEDANTDAGEKSNSSGDEESKTVGTEAKAEILGDTREVTSKAGSVYEKPDSSSNISESVGDGVIKGEDKELLVLVEKTGSSQVEAKLTDAWSKTDGDGGKCSDDEATSNSGPSTTKNDVDVKNLKTTSDRDLCEEKEGDKEDVDEVIEQSESVDKNSEDEKGENENRITEENSTLPETALVERNGEAKEVHKTDDGEAQQRQASDDPLKARPKGFENDGEAVQNTNRETEEETLGSKKLKEPERDTTLDAIGNDMNMSKETDTESSVPSKVENGATTTLKPEPPTSSGTAQQKSSLSREEQTHKGDSQSKSDEPGPICVVSLSVPSNSEIISSGHSVLPMPKADPYFQQLRSEEDRINQIRRSISTRRGRKKGETKDTAATNTKKKRKRDSGVFKPSLIPGWRASVAKEFTLEQEDEWLKASRQANETVERWMTSYRMSRESYWMGIDRAAKEKAPRKPTFYLHQEEPDPTPSCQWCVVDEHKRATKSTSKKSNGQRKSFTGDELMRCLECSVIACSPSSLAPRSRNHMMQHLFMSGHQFAVSCGMKAEIFCFGCGDIVYHDVFEQEKIRIDCSKRLNYMSWKEHRILRSFDAFRFLKTQDHGIVWRGLVATYPPTVPKEHFFATQLTMRRQALFEGNAEETWMLLKPNALKFSAIQHTKSDEDKYAMAAPVGMYNHGNTCYMSAILQCLVFCQPLKHYFLKNIGHHHKSCELYRREIDSRASSTKPRQSSSKSKKGPLSSTKASTAKAATQICLACEVDRLFLSYYGSANGVDVLASLEEASGGLVGNDVDDAQTQLFEGTIERGSPLLISDLITSAWKSGGMDHLAGYEQRDAHEFLNSFLELLGKDIVKFRDRVYGSVTCIGEENALSEKPKSADTDIVSHLFEGSFRSVLLCESCGVKRIQHEPFVNISLSLSEEVERMQRGKGQELVDISVEACLEHFVLPEKLGDLVYCTSCGKKTVTKKQHTFSKLPKVLCLHLKRFDAAQNKKIENFVSYPAKGLNMGGFLSHWCEVSRLGSSNDKLTPGTEPRIIYDLFGTVNHKGNMQSGHYVANVKVGHQWHSCNDQMVRHATEGQVLKADGAYVLFYMRKRC